ncbi:MAG TPA: methyltransferase domain-containing protein [Candidatus Tumulicola sp.]|nr:methyltransferase domain-containing protein [Candidatus Tumulicola sp.]
MNDATTRLREAMVAQLERAGVLRTPAVAAAMRAVPRHLFLPGLALDDAYADRAVALKTDGSQIVSSVSQPAMIALMLELLAASPGDRLLEIGTGSGYNAALLAEIVGPSGSVTTLDLDAELAERAAAVLRELGYATVRVTAADGGAAVSESGAFDGVIVTARSDDVASAWWRALARRARLVLPLRLEGAGEYAVGFSLECDGRLHSVGVHPCAFIALRGEAAVESTSTIFYRHPETRGSSPACLRAVAEITAVRRENATPALLGDADVVIARPVSVFAVTFAA